jgi:anti-anti-sigma factor
MIDKDGIKITLKLIDKNNKILLINLGGYVDQANVHNLQQTITDCLNNANYKLIFNLSELAYMSSAGWGVIIGEIKRFRENKGDIKVVNMGPEIYEVYQMLEFYHIISEYTSLEKAMESFSNKKDKNTTIEMHVKTNPSAEEDLKQDNQKDKVLISKDKKSNNEDELLSEATAFENEKGEITENEVDLNIDEAIDQNINLSYEREDRKSYVPFNPKPEGPLDLKVLPVSEKIKQIISKYPQFKANKIKKILRHPEYGETKIGYFKVKRYLKELDLDTKEKRYRFYRSS